MLRKLAEYVSIKFTFPFIQDLISPDLLHKLLENEENIYFINFPFCDLYYWGSFFFLLKHLLLQAYSTGVFFFFNLFVIGSCDFQRRKYVTIWHFKLVNWCITIHTSNNEPKRKIFFSCSTMLSYDFIFSWCDTSELCVFMYVHITVWGYVYVHAFIAVYTYKLYIPEINRKRNSTASCDFIFGTLFNKMLTLCMKIYLSHLLIYSSNILLMIFRTQTPRIYYSNCLVRYYAPRE